MPIDLRTSGPRLPQPDAIVVMPFAQDKDFVAREDILSSLEEGFSESTTLRRMALAGLGGIGYDLLPRSGDIADKKK